MGSQDSPGGNAGPPDPAASAPPPEPSAVDPEVSGAPPTEGGDLPTGLRKPDTSGPGRELPVDPVRGPAAVDETRAGVPALPGDTRFERPAEERLPGLYGTTPGYGVPVSEVLRRAFPEAASAAGADHVTDTVAQTRPGGGPPGGAATDEAPRLGIPFGRYFLQEEIGRGAMGVVYRAIDLQLRRLVALKVLPSAEKPTEEMTLRFQREAFLAARVQHPGIVQVHDVGETDGRLYYTMELVEGDSLQVVMRAMQRIPPRIALLITREAARAVQAAHEQNLVHRDLKPANILIAAREHPGGGPPEGADGRVVVRGRAAPWFRVLVTDFGVAKDIAGQTVMTRTGALVGTPAYMSPEQAGMSRPLGPWTDVYALGVVLYHMLAGRLPFDETDPLRLMVAVISEDPPGLRRIAPGLHPDLGTIVAKAMAKEPNQRYRNAGEFADDLDRYLAGEMIRARPATIYQRLCGTIRRHRPAVISALGAILAVGLLAAWLLGWPAWQAWRAERSAREQRSARAELSRIRHRAAEADFAAGRLDAAADAARKAVLEWSPFAARGEDVTLAQWHDLLARIHLRRTPPERPQALLEHYRAYRAALGTPGGDSFLLGAARELVEQGRFHEAGALLQRLVRRAADPSVLAEGQYWLGRSAEGMFEFREAADRYRIALEGPDLPETVRPACREHLQFAAGLSARRDLDRPPPESVPLPQLDDGRRLGVRVERNFVVVGGYRDAAFSEVARLTLASSEGRTFQFLGAAPEVNRAGVDLILGAAPAAGAGEGSLRVIHWSGRALEERLRRVVPAAATHAAIGDLDGDGAREIIVVHANRERPLSVYRYAAGADPPATVDWTSPSVTYRLEVADLDADGRDEILVFQGEWQTWGVVLLKWNPDRKSVEVADRIVLGVPSQVVRLDRAGRPPVFAVAISWNRLMTHPLRMLHGVQAFERTYRPSGAYWLEAGPDLRLRARPLIEVSWEKNGVGTCSFTRLHRGDGDTLWVHLSESEMWDPSLPPEADVRSHVFRIDHDGLQPFTILTPSEGGAVDPAGLMWAADLDGDGQDHLLSSSRLFTRAFGPGTEAASGNAGGAAVPAGGAMRGTSLRSEAAEAGTTLLEFAGDARGAGLLEEALSAYREAVVTATQPSETAEALRGELRCLVDLGRVQEAATMAIDAADRMPAVEGPILREGWEIDMIPAASLIRVDEDSPWRLAGVRPLDVVSRVDGVGVGGADLLHAALESAVRSGRDRVTLTLHRGQESVDIVVPPRADGWTGVDFLMERLRAR